MNIYVYQNIFPEASDYYIQFITLWYHLYVYGCPSRLYAYIVSKCGIDDRV